MQNLEINTPIVDANGMPTPYFMRLLQTRGLLQGDDHDLLTALLARIVEGLDGTITVTNGALTDTGNIKIAAKIQFLLDQISAVRGTVLYRGAAGWSGLAPGTSGDVLSTNGAGADPSWITPSGGGGGRTLIQRIVTAGSQTFATFSSIPQIYSDLEIIAVGRGDAAATTTQIRSNFNGDTGGNYDFVEIDQAGTGAGIAQGGNSFIGVTGGQLGFMAAASAPAGVADLAIAHIGDYRGVWQKAMIADSTLKAAAAHNNVWNIRCVNWWRNTAPITDINIFPFPGNWANGSVISLYGLS